MAIKIENIVPPSISQWMAVIHGLRNPYESWSKMDSTWDLIEDPLPINPDDTVYIKIGENDLDLMRRLAKAGSDHRKFLRQLPVIMDVTAPLYFWKEADQYKVGTVTNSCSTMHTLHKRDLTADDFSCEYCPGVIGGVIETINGWRKRYIETNDKKCWYAMIQMLPESFNQTRTLSCNYEVLWNMWQARKGHRLDEWRLFRNSIARNVPYFKEIFEFDNDGSV